MSGLFRCRVCGGGAREFLDLGRQPLSDAFVDPAAPGEEFFFRLAVGACAECSMVQLAEEVPRESMFHEGYPYLSSGSTVMREHFRSLAERLLKTELTGVDPFVVEMGCNDGVMLSTLAAAGVRHLGVEPSGGVAARAESRGVRVRRDFFDEDCAAAIRDAEGPADVVYAANTMCHIPYLDSVFRGVDTLLAPGGILVFEDPYLGDILAKTSFDQIYDEHFYLFSATSVAAAAERFGLELVDVERLPVHGGEVRYTLARAGARRPGPAVGRLLAEERERGLTHPGTLEAFARAVARVREDLVALLRRARRDGQRVMGYGATAKSATLLNHCGIGPDLVPAICDTTPAKQGRLTPGSRIPVVPPTAFGPPYPDLALLLAWNHAGEIAAKEEEFRRAGGRWIHYVPAVRID
ncbi:class I SAM-dependent methyltransferase [Streptomyces calidiresistens]|uniref:Methyltransferase domain-containing protein n=1 Tax=Streptomyces calidiresistens TaxID=1485586 RepID=A0A7W3XVN2_9ACTN|nr:class I SAM-dependent methyltransferase [Streptomyces calidiresistens]MBB0228892.1 methyltransferase domain-containing protein [Streptomyces calidiresistens]